MANAPHAGVPIAGASPPGPAWFRFFADLARRLDVVVASDAGKQPLDDDLTALAALTTTAFGRGFLELADAAAGRTKIGVRDVLTANRTYYVRTDGSNGNNGLANTAGGAFLTLQKAVDVVASLDRSTFAITIEIGAGTFTGGCDITGWGPGSGQVTFNGAGIASTTISTTSDDCFNIAHARCAIQNLKMQTTTAGSCIRTGFGADVTHGAVDFGATPLAQIWAEYPSRVFGGAANYTISGGAIAHILCRYNAVVSSFSGTVTISNTPAFSSAFALLSMGGILEYGGRTFVGSATGPRYLATTNAALSVSGGGATYLPGDSAGSASSGGQYV